MTAENRVAVDAGPTIRAAVQAAQEAHPDGPNNVVAATALQITCNAFRHIGHIVGMTDEALQQFMLESWDAATPATPEDVAAVHQGWEGKVH